MGLVWTLLKVWLTSDSVKSGGKKAAKGAAKGASIIGLVAATQVVTMQKVDERISAEVSKQEIVLANLKDDTREIKSNLRMILREMLRRQAKNEQVIGPYTVNVNDPTRGVTASVLTTKNLKEN